jgi:hypothetical protein
MHGAGMLLAVLEERMQLAASQSVYSTEFSYREIRYGKI